LQDDGLLTERLDVHPSNNSHNVSAM